MRKLLVIGCTVIFALAVADVGGSKEKAPGSMTVAQGKGKAPVGKGKAPPPPIVTKG